MDGMHGGHTSAHVASSGISRRLLNGATVGDRPEDAGATCAEASASHSPTAIFSSSAIERWPSKEVAGGSGWWMASRSLGFVKAGFGGFLSSEFGEFAHHVLRNARASAAAAPLLALQASGASASLAARGPPAGGGKRVLHAKDTQWAYKAAADEDAGRASKRRRGRCRSSKRQARNARFRGYSDHHSHVINLEWREVQARRRKGRRHLVD